VKSTYVILSLVFKQNLTPILGGAQVQVMVISIIGPMKKKMVNEVFNGSTSNMKTFV